MITFGMSSNVKKIVATLGLAGILIYIINSIVDLAKVQKMNAITKPVCVGRVIVDAPIEVQVNYGRILISGWFITNIVETEEQFNARLIEKENELKNAINEKGRASLEATRFIETPDFQGKIFTYNRQWTDWFEGDKQVFANFAAVYAYVHGNGLSFSFASDSSDDRVAELIQMIKQMTLRKSDDIPSRPGFCIGRAFLNDPPLNEQTENVVAFFTFPRNPDFGVALQSAGGLRPSPPLLTRVSKASVDIISRRVVLRRGEREINGFQGQEFVERFLESNGASTHNFTWESSSDQADLLRPELNFELSTGISARPGGAPVDASLSDIALLSLWDQMLSTIRLRPTEQKVVATR